jgi:hypothetical protein
LSIDITTDERCACDGTCDNTSEDARYDDAIRSGAHLVAKQLCGASAILAALDSTLSAVSGRLEVIEQLQCRLLRFVTEVRARIRSPTCLRMYDDSPDVVEI